MSKCKETIVAYLEFIAYNIEKKGQPKGDSAGATIYGITKKYYPSEFGRIARAIEQGNEYETVMEIYLGLFKKCNAGSLAFPLNIQYFDYWFHKPKLAGMSLQTVINEMICEEGQSITVDGIVGKKTIEAYNYVASYIPIQKLHRLFVLDRIHTYMNTGSSFEKGWVNRVIRLERFILTKDIK